MHTQTILQQLGIQLPIFLAPMAGVSTPTLAACVSNQGGLGSLGLGASTAEQAHAQILATQALTDQPFQVNFFCHDVIHYNEQQAQKWIDYLAPHFAEFSAEKPKTLKKIYASFIENDELLNVVLETKPKAVSFHFGLPLPHQMQSLKQAGIITLATVTNLTEAIQAEQAGIDILVAQGIEAGGHRGLFNPHCDSGLSTLDLLILLNHEINLPIVVAGGIMSGHDIAMYLNLGASACQLGTAFVICPESAASDAYRQALLEQPITQISDSLSGRPARGLLNAWHKYVDTPQRPAHAGYPYTYDLAKQLHQIASQQGEQGYGAFWAGSHVSAIRNYDATQLMQVLQQELAETSVK